MPLRLTKDRTTEKVYKVLSLLPLLISECFKEGKVEEDNRAEVNDVLVILQERTNELQDPSQKQAYQTAIDEIETNPK